MVRGKANAKGEGDCKSCYIEYSEARGRQHVRVAKNSHGGRGIAERTA